MLRGKRWITVLLEAYDASTEVGELDAVRARCGDLVAAVVKTSMFT